MKEKGRKDMSARATPRDEIITEVRAIREQLAARFGYDVDRLYDEAKRREQASDRETMPAAPRRVPGVS